jgi:hypothetical protein
VNPGSERREAPRWRRSVRPAAVVAALMIGLGGLAGAAGMGLGAIAAGADHPYVHGGHDFDQADTDGLGP